MPVSHDAFMSYSHEADVALAPALERGLERLARPMFQLRAIDVFRDQTSLSASPGVWSGILEHLSGSRWFIFLASPGAAGSPWCCKELRWWLDECGIARLLVVLTEGSIEWDEAVGDFDWSRTTALPREVVTGRFAEVPLYVDLRWARDAGRIDARDPRLRTACLDLVAPVRGLPKDRLDGEDVRQLRRTRMLARAAVATITVAAALAVWQAIEANRQRAQAEAEREQAVSRQLAAQAAEMRVREPVLALLLAAQAHAVVPTPEAAATLIALARALPLQRIVEHELRFSSLAARPGTGVIYAGDSGGDLWRMDLAGDGWTLVHRGRGGLLAGPAAHTVSDDGAMVAFAGYGGTISLWRDGRVERTLLSPVEKEQITLDLSFSADGRRLAAATQVLDGSAGSNGHVMVYDLDSGQPRRVQGGGAAARVRFSPDGRWLAVGGDLGSLALHAMRPRDKAPELPRGGAGSVVALAFADGGRRLFVAWSLGRIDIFDLEQGRRSDWIATLDHGLVESMVVAAGGHMLVTAHADGAVVRWVRDDEGRRWDATELYRHASAPAGMALLDAGTRLASADRDGRIFIAHDLHLTPPARLQWQSPVPLHDAWLDASAARIGVRTATGGGWFVPGRAQLDDAVPAPTRAPAIGLGSEELARHGERVLRRRDNEAVLGGPEERVLAAGGAVAAAAFGPDGRVLYTLVERRVQAWDSVSGAQLGSAIDVGAGAAGLAASPDGRWLVVLHAAPLQIGRLERGVRRPSLSVLALPDLQPRVQQVELALDDAGLFGPQALFTRDGTRLYLHGESTVAVFDLGAMQRVESPLPLGRGVRVLGLADGAEPLWLADGRGGRLLTLDLRGDRLADWACALARRALSAEEWTRYLGSARTYAPRCRAGP